MHDPGRFPAPPPPVKEIPEKKGKKGKKKAIEAEGSETEPPCLRTRV
jgi:hypothetical protein